MKRNYLSLFSFLLMAIGFYQQALAQENRKVEIAFEGNKVFSSKELLDVLGKCRGKAQKYEAEQFDSLIDYCLQKSVRDFMSSKGYFAARIGSIRKEQIGNGLKAIVFIEEGKQYRLGDISIEDAKTFTEPELLALLPLKKGDIADGVMIKDWVYGKLKDRYAEKGFVQFDAELEPVFKDDVVNIRLMIDEGTRFTIDRIRFTGDTDLRASYLKRYLTFDEQEIYNRRKLVESIENLNNLGMFQRIDVDRDVQLRTDGEISLINLTINIKKKQQ